MTIRIVDNKKVDMIDIEWDMYQTLCKNYTEPHQKGEYFFKDMIETDGEGTIVFVKPPTGKRSSLEIMFFLYSLMISQHLRLNRKIVDTFVEEGKAVIKEHVENLKK